MNVTLLGPDPLDRLSFKKSMVPGIKMKTTPTDSCSDSPTNSPSDSLHDLSPAGPQGLESIRQGIAVARAPHAPTAQGYACSFLDGDLPVHYAHHERSGGIHFQVSKLPFEQLQAMEARLLTIAPGSTNEKHRHAHESIFVVLQGEAQLSIGGQVVGLAQGDVAYVPRWCVHQTRNVSQESELRLLAITDFGLTSAVIGNYDKATRLKTGGAQAFL